MFRRLGRALLLRCPNCGRRGVVSGWFDLAESCPRCRLRFERHEGYWLGAIAINTIVAIGVLAATLVGLTIAWWPDPPWQRILVIVVLATAAAPIAFYPWSKTIWVALELTVHPAEPPG